MNQTHRLLLATNGATALLGRLDLAALPALSALHVGQNHRDNWKTGVMAMLNSYGLSELEQINAIRTWAAALGGVLHLDEDDYCDGNNAHRQLAAVADLPDGSRFEVGTHLYRAPVPVPEPAAA